MSENLRRPAVLFDFYLTLVDIWTDEEKIEVWEKLALFLSYDNIFVEATDLRSQYFALAEQRYLSNAELYPEVDVVGVFTRLLNDLSLSDSSAVAPDVARLFRASSRVRFGVFPDVVPALRRLRPHFDLGIVSDAQAIFFWPEVTLTGLSRWMDVIVISGDHGFTKPDPRLFRTALSALNIPPAEVTFVGDCIDRDICGASASHIRPVLLDRAGKLDGSASTCRPERVIRAMDELCDWLIRE